MTHPDAITTLRSGGPLHELLEAVSVAAATPATTSEELALGLNYPGVVAEQTAFALYRRLGKPLPIDRSRLIRDLCETLGIPYGDAHSEELPNIPLDTLSDEDVSDSDPLDAATHPTR